MGTKPTIMISPRSLQLVIIITVVILLVPFIAMNMNASIDWDGFDFLILAAALFVAGVLSAFFLKRFPNLKYKTLIVAFILIVLALVLIELGVGIFGSSYAGT